MARFNKKIMLVGALTFEKFHRKPKDTIGGSRIRINNMIKYWDEAEIFKYGRQYDAMIYQKVYWIEHAKAFNGVKILDLCDPDFMHWGYKTVEMINNCDAVVTSTPALRDAIENFVTKPVVCIPDRMDLNNYPYKKVHTKEATKIGWFGYSHNFHAINESGVLKGIIDLHKGIEFVIISDSIYVPPAFAKDKIKITNIKWTKETVDQDIQRCDIMVNPHLETSNWKFKSNNKTLHSWALGIPVADSIEDIKRFIDPKERTNEIKMRAKELKEKWDIQQSLGEYKQLIKDLYGKRTFKN